MSAALIYADNAPSFTLLGDQHDDAASDGRPALEKATNRACLRYWTSCAQSPARLLGSAEALRRRGKLDQAFCIVLDIDLRDASGIELRRWLAVSWGTLPVIFVTGNNDHAARKAAFESGWVAYVRKPFPTKKSLMEAIRGASIGSADAMGQRPTSLPLIRSACQGSSNGGGSYRPIVLAVLSRGLACRKSVPFGCVGLTFIATDGRES